MNNCVPVYKELVKKIHRFNFEVENGQNNLVEVLKDLAAYHKDNQALLDPFQ